MVWRKKWARVWSEVRYCSERCRSAGIRSIDASAEQAIRSLLDERPGGATICASDAARRAGGDHPWPALMETTRAAARRLAAAGAIEIVQGGVVVDPSTAKGPIRLRISRARRL